MLKVPVVSSQP